MAQVRTPRKPMTKAGALLERYKKLREMDGDAMGPEMDGLPPIPTSQDVDMTNDGSDNTPDAEMLFPFPQEGDMAMDGSGSDVEDDDMAAGMTGMDDDDEEYDWDDDSDDDDDMMK